MLLLHVICPVCCTVVHFVLQAPQNFYFRPGLGWELL